MKKVQVTAYGGQIVKIEAPDDKQIVFDGGLLQHGILVLGEYGPSGTKIAAFKDWTEAMFIEEGDGAGYTITRS